MQAENPRLKFCLLCLAGTLVALYPNIIKLLAPDSTSAFDLTKMATFNAAHVAVVSALLWALNAKNGEDEYNAAAAIFSAAAAFFASASFKLPGEAASTVPWADEVRILLSFSIAIGILVAFTGWKFSQYLCSTICQREHRQAPPAAPILPAHSGIYDAGREAKPNTSETTQLRADPVADVAVTEQIGTDEDKPSSK